VLRNVHERKRRIGHSEDRFLTRRRMEAGGGLPVRPTHQAGRRGNPQTYRVGVGGSKKGARHDRPHMINQSMNGEMIIGRRESVV
jgi:hypothetical protein